MNIIIRKPLITEKATAASESRNRFTFEVAKSANKIEIKKAVEKMYGVNIVKVRTMTYGGGKSSIKQTNRGIVVQPNNPWKKAIVTVADGETIDLFNNILEKRMGLKKFKPTTPGQRHKINSTYAEVTTNVPEKSLVVGKTKSGGRNNDGRMTMRYIGGGHKQKYRIVDFKRDKQDIPATVKTIEYDPNRTARIALLWYADGEKRYIIAPEGLKVGDTVLSGKTALPNVGHAMFLSDVPLGTVIHNIELKPGKGGAIARGAGTYAQLNARDGRYAIIKMPSGETRMILTTCMATIGSVSNSEHSLVVSGKAGRSRWLGRRPRVRGVVMNPVDHPMGGGEGRNSGGHPRSRNGMPAKGYKTRSKTKYSDKFIIEKRKK